MTGDVTMHKIQDTAQLDALLSQPRAVVVLWVDWAIHARRSADSAEQMIARWNREHPDASVDLSQIDLSEQAGEIWDAAGDWLSSQKVADVGVLMYSGAGSILWMRSGHLVRYVLNGNSKTVDELLELMNESFGPLEPNTQAP